MEKMSKVKIPQDGQKISMIDGKLSIPNNPIIPYIEGDGIGEDIWAAAVRVLDSAIEITYDKSRKIKAK